MIHARERVTEAMMKELRDDYRDKDGNYKNPGDAGSTAYLNPIYLMTQSGGPWKRGPDPAARGYAGVDGQTVGRNHRDADQGQLPRGPVRAGVFQFHARRAEGSGGYRLEDRGLRVPDEEIG